MPVIPLPNAGGGSGPAIQAHGSGPVPMTDPAERLRPWLILTLAPGVGPVAVRRARERFGGPQAAIEADRQALREAGLSDEAVDALRRPDAERLDAALEWQARPGNHLLCLDDPAYPALLRDIPDPPPLLYVIGDPEVLGRKQLALVGSRNPTPAGRETAHEFARHLAANGLVVTSGLALGVDGAAHAGALAAGGLTVAVSGTGADRIYPARHRDLAHKIAETGAIVSEFPLGTSPSPGNFPRRNRIIAGLSLGVLVIEAALRSGSLITARLAAEQGREVFAVPGSIHNPQARGCNALIRQGAKLVETADDIFEELGGFAGPLADEEPSALDAVSDWKPDPEYERVLASIGDEPTAVDTVVERSGLTTDAVCSMLLVLELQGLIAATSSGHYCRTRHRPGTD